MPGMDQEVFNLDERLASDDLNTAQGLIHREVLDSLRWMFAQPTFGGLGSSMSSTIRAVVLGGLEVVPSGNDVQINPGVLLQDSTALVPTPGALDSNYRVAVNRSALTVSMPSPGADSWLIVEVQMQQVIAETRTVDIFDPVTRTFSGQSKTKRLERTILAQATAATAATIPAFTGGDWIPIAIVRRPNGGGPVLTTDIYDIRPLWAARVGSGQALSSSMLALQPQRHCRWWTEGMNGTSSNNIHLDFMEAITRRGERLWLQANGNVDITAAPIKSSGLVLAASTWYYLYLTPWRNVGVRTWSQQCQGNGLLVLSAVSPTAQGFNNGALTPGAPFDSSTISTGEAVCVGAVFRDASNTFWGGVYTADGSLFKVSQSASPTIATLAPPLATQNINLGVNVPAHARSAIIRGSWVGGGAGMVLQTVSINPTGGSTMELDGERYVDDHSTTVNAAFEFEIPCEALQALTFDLRVTGGAPNAATVCVLSLVGWRQ